MLSHGGPLLQSEYTSHYAEVGYGYLKWTRWVQIYRYEIKWKRHQHQCTFPACKTWAALRSEHEFIKGLRQTPVVNGCGVCLGRMVRLDLRKNSKNVSSHFGKLSIEQKDSQNIPPEWIGCVNDCANDSEMITGVQKIPWEQTKYL